MSMDRSQVDTLIAEFGRKIAQLTSTNDELQLQLSKHEILNKARSDRIAEFESERESMTALLHAEQSKSTNLENELRECLAVIDNLLSENREIRIENSQVQDLRVELVKAREMSSRFEGMYMELATRGPLGVNSFPAPTQSAVYPIVSKPQTSVLHHRSVQTETVLTLTKPTQTVSTKPDVDVEFDSNSVIVRE